MIRDKSEYLNYLNLDKKHMNFAREKLNKCDPIWRFLRLLRTCEYYKGKKGLFYKFVYLFYRYRFEKLSIKLGYSIPLNTIGPGLNLPHRGTLIIAKNAKIGNNARIHCGVNIGGTDAGFPVIGNNVYIGPGAKIFGDIVLGDNIKIGANAVVNKSFPEENCTLVGAPAKIVNESKK